MLIIDVGSYCYSYSIRVSEFNIVESKDRTNGKRLIFIGRYVVGQSIIATYAKG